eukprot:scaffold174405_cov47-Prasinocladus_malaysianus.AAC.1
MSSNHCVAGTNTSLSGRSAVKPHAGHTCKKKVSVLEAVTDEMDEATHIMVRACRHACECRSLSRTCLDEPLEGGRLAGFVRSIR